MLRWEHCDRGDWHLFGYMPTMWPCFCRTSKPHCSVPCYCASFLFCAQRFEAGDDIEEFLIDTILAQTMKCPVKILQ